MRTRWILIVMGLIFVGVLAAIIGWRLSSEAMAVLMGVAAGVIASIPTSLIMVWITTRQMRATQEAQLTQYRAPAPAANPPVVVLAPAPVPAQAGRQANWLTPPPALPARRFSVIGGEPQWEEERMLASAQRALEDVWPS